MQAISVQDVCNAIDRLLATGVRLHTLRGDS
jgi:hypothetical protein